VNQHIKNNTKKGHSITIHQISATHQTVGQHLGNSKN